MKHALQVLIFATACMAGGAHAAQEADEGAACRIDSDDTALLALNFPKITFGFRVAAFSVESAATA